MTDECKELEQKAKNLEKENPKKSVDLYKQASQCFEKIDNIKNKNSNLEKAAKVLKGLAKLDDNPVVSLDYYEQASQLYLAVDKATEAEKINRDAHLKFITAAKMMKSEASKMDDIYAAEKKLEMASEYALLGNDEHLSNECWVESANQFNKMATQMEKPIEALEVFKHAVVNYRKGQQENEQSVLREAAYKFAKKGTEIYKARKSLVNALYNYEQAIKIYNQIGSEQEALQGEQRIQEICEEIGFNRELILHQLENEGMVEVSLLPTETKKDDTKEDDQDLLDSDVEEMLARSDEKLEPLTREVPPTKPLETTEATIPTVTDEKLEPLTPEFPPAKPIETAEATIPTDEIVDKSTVSAAEVSIPDTIPQTPQKESPVDDEFDVNTYFAQKLKEKLEQKQHITSTPHEIVHDKAKDETFPESQVPSGARDEIKKVPAGAKVSDQIVEILREQGYIGEHVVTDADLFKVPEYQTLWIIISNHPISLDEIEARTDISSISLVLSNLQADDLIEYTNDYRWTISQRVIDIL
ncbi:MAG: hypothetical protein ACXAD7_01570 [Candidatus Kariarchaeaceae archaeon]